MKMNENYISTDYQRRYVRYLTNKISGSLFNDTTPLPFPLILLLMTLLLLAV